MASLGPSEGRMAGGDGVNLGVRATNRRHAVAR